MRTAIAGLLTGLTALALAMGPASGSDVPAAHTVTSIPTVGPLFFPSVLGLFPRLGGPHFCTASVLDSPGRDLAITAAHCVYGPGATIEFAPGFHDGVAPYGVWDVRRIYLDPAWRARRDPTRDVAILQVAPLGGHPLEDVVGAGEPLATPVAGRRVTVDGYPLGPGGRPITCTNTLVMSEGYPSFDCTGYVPGVSGGPWLQRGRVVGVVGGREQGGCGAATSYSAPFGASTRALLRRASAGERGDVAPLAFFANDC